MKSQRYPETIAVASDSPSALQQRDAEYLGRAASPRRIAAAFVTLAACAVLLAVRSADLQIRSGHTYAGAASANRQRETIVVPERGALTDRVGRLLTASEPQYAIAVVPADVPLGSARDAAIAAIASAIAREPADVQAALDAYPRGLPEPVIVRDALTREDAIAVLARAGAEHALRIVVEDVRRYIGANGAPLESMSHITGYLGRISAEAFARRNGTRYRPSDRVGIAGVERQYETMLRGTPGTQLVTSDAGGRATTVTAQEQAIAGAAVALTVDADLQHIAERSLRRGIAAAGARRGAAIALDPTTGDVLALVSVPTFSASALTRGVSPAEAATIFANPDQPLFNRAVSGTYPPGSTVKPIIAAAALSQGVATERTRILSTGGLRVEGSYFPDWRAGGHGWVTVREAIAQSVNTFFYLIGGGKPRAASTRMVGPTQEQALGPERIAEALRAFGLGAPTGIDLPSEASGLVPGPAWKQRERGLEWFIGDTYHLAIGQGDILVTPLQMAVATAAFANGGYRVVPRVVLFDPPPLQEGELEGVGSEKSQISNLKSQIHGLTLDALLAVRRGMRAAVMEGSAAGLNVFPFPVYGKTGTAEHGKGKRPHAWFVGFAERTEIGNRKSEIGNSVVIVVLIEEGGEGSSAAVPVARDILFAWNGLST